MKKIGPLLLLVLLLGGGYWVYTSVLGGSLTGTGPTNVPDPDVDLPEPDDAVNKGADKATEGANWLVDFLVGISPATWKIVGILIVVAAVVWVIKNPKRLAIALGVAVVGLLVMLIG